ncbi:hypothetical protein [Kordiimonas sp.]|uniref:hypothetical protein n=1 Tax=Kordiimonas sp. TaxID=1970157 RepID=UPI003A9449F5
MKSRDRNQVRQDFEDAIERILVGKPQNSKLFAKAKRGQLKMNIANVALEAGRSRTLIGTADTEYADIRKRIIELMGVGGGVSEAERVIKELREQRDLYRVERDRAMSEAHNYLVQLEKAQNRIDQLKALLGRLQSSATVRVSSVVSIADRMTKTRSTDDDA